MKARMARPAFAEASQDFCFCSTTPKYSSDPGNCTQKRLDRAITYNLLIYIVFRRLLWPSRTTATRKNKRKPPEKLGRMPNNNGARQRKRFPPSPPPLSLANELRPRSVDDAIPRRRLR